MLKDKLNLQFFAEGGEGETKGEGQEQEETLTMEAVQKMIQSETDKVRTEYSQRLKAVESEKEELEKERMTEEEKTKFELEKYEKELADKEQAIALKELTIKTVDLLKEEELPLEFREFLIGVDEEATKANVSTFKELWNKAIKEEVEGRFKDNGRDINRSKGKGTMTKDEIMGIKNPVERLKAIRENKDLF